MPNRTTIASATIVPEVEYTQFAESCGPELDYAQVLSEAHSYLATRSSICKSPICVRISNKIQEEQKSSSSHSWKNTLFFWKKHWKGKSVSTISSPQHALSRSLSKAASAPQKPEYHRKKVKSGPIYSGDNPSAPSHRSSRCLSGPIGGLTSSTVPYKQLEHRSRRVSSKAPIYMVS